MTHSFFIMHWSVYLVIDVLSIPFVTSIITQTDFPGLVDLGQYSESDGNPDLGPVDLNSVSTRLSPDILAGVASNTLDMNNDLTTASSDCSFDIIGSTDQFQRRQISSSGSGCSYTPPIEPLRQEETEANPSTLISSALTGHEDTKSDRQPLKTTDATSPVTQMEEGDEGGFGRGAIPLGQPVIGGGAHPEKPNQERLSPNLNNSVRFRFEICPYKKFKHRQTPACDGGKKEYILKGVQDYTLLHARVPRIGTSLYNPCRTLSSLTLKKFFSSSRIFVARTFAENHMNIGPRNRPACPGSKTMTWWCCLSMPRIMSGDFVSFFFPSLFSIFRLAKTPRPCAKNSQPFCKIIFPEKPPN